MSSAVTAVYRFDDLEARLTGCENRHRLFDDTEFKAVFFDRLSVLFGQKEERTILSLDIFDTLLLRDNSSELSRFHDIGAAMAELLATEADLQISAEEAFFARYLGTRATYRCRDLYQGNREGSLTEIHNTASRILTGSDRFGNRFVELELAYEATRTVPNRTLLDYMAQHRAKGGQVVLITDMYMHATQVEQLLAVHEISAADYDVLVSSADTIVSKASGKIFAVVEAQMDARPDAFVHLGDSLRGDFQQPIAQGWAAMHLPLSETCIAERQDDHRRAAALLKERCGYTTDIALPR